MYTRALYIASILACLLMASYAQAIKAEGYETAAIIGETQLKDIHQVTFATNGFIDEINVEIGDLVGEGELLITLKDPTLKLAVQQAQLEIEAAKAALQILQETVLASDIEMAKAKLLLAQETLARAEVGPTAEELQAANSRVTAAWAAYNELIEGATTPAINQAYAQWQTSAVNLQEAQRAYDKISWKPEVSMTAEADQLHRATLEHDAAKANYDLLSQPALASKTQLALASAQQAQHELNMLNGKPTSAERAEAIASVAIAQAELDKLTKGSSQAAIRQAEVNIQIAELQLEMAKQNLQDAQIQAPTDGMILDIRVDTGQFGTAGTTAMTLAVPNDLELITYIEQDRIDKIQIGQAVEFTLRALSNQAYTGKIKSILPVGQVMQGTILYPVIIEVEDELSQNALPGMAVSVKMVPTLGVKLEQ